MSTPLVSVVVSVYNAGRYLRPSLQSVLDQEGVTLELILVDDGSTDGSGTVLDELARRDPRVRLLRHENCGLTRSLIRGCKEARGRFIARHDADDLSLPGRLAKQVALLRADPRLSFAACWARTVGPEDEVLFETPRPLDPVEATAELTANLVNPQHGSVMFPADVYQNAGGYRPAFRYAQDCDLWLRLAEQGLLGYVPEVLYTFRVSDQAISTSRRAQQFRLVEQARLCRAARRQGESEAPYLDEAARISMEPATRGKAARSGNSYFIGKCLLDRRDPRAVAYLRQSLRQNPWQLRGWAALLKAGMVCGRQGGAEARGGRGV